MDYLFTTFLPFLEAIGIDYSLETINEDTFLPGLKLRSGTLVIDTEKLLYPGDVLHEAGHLACVPPEVRESLSDTIENNDANAAVEMMALAWSYAAALHLGIDPYIVFHEHGYKGGAKGIVEGYQNGNIMGIPMLQIYGLCYDYNMATQLNTLPFPYMQKWVCEFNPFEKPNII
ncbi:hypothetical protein [Mucilaginibacter jinjuensis]|uniref:Uncharacterized protein n=1 Tax=Mucilaginibacter jinjuensis TaxID=1176721 RepID=A0ABY7TCA4_9SPHI|nr:hypothetical protein [Mucilaginibacter jinjuensis]WCT14071.1 hypothetical protein PQO05_09000 [Mucilaginibacter jinjuensis]